jgi:hypothetical protein
VDDSSKLLPGANQRAAYRHRGIRSALRQRVLPFTGLIPVVVMVPVLAFNLYAVAIVAGIVSGVAVIAYHVGKGRGHEPRSDAAWVRIAQRGALFRS